MMIPTIKHFSLGIAVLTVLVVVGSGAFFLGARSVSTQHNTNIQATDDRVSGDTKEADDLGERDTQDAVAPAVAFQQHSVGYLGCSMTVNAIEGYHTEGGKVLWGETGDFGGGTISAWAGLLPTSNAYWNGFDAILAKNPGTNAAWMELCISVKKGGTTNDTYENAVKVRNEILARIPNATIYVSAQPSYTNGHVCGIAGADGPAKMQAIADQMVANGLAKRGPVLGPLADGQTADPCHANGIGKSIMGKQLIEFFDR